MTKIQLFHLTKPKNEVSSVIEVPPFRYKSILNGLGERNVQTEKPSTFELKNIRKQIRLQYPLKLFLREYCRLT